MGNSISGVRVRAHLVGAVSLLTAVASSAAAAVPVIVPGRTITQTIPEQYTPAITQTPVGTPSITVPRTCAGAVICAGPVFIPAVPVTTVGPVAPIQVTPPITVTLSTPGMDAEVAPSLGTLITLPPTTVYIPNPLSGPPIPVDVCPEGCDVPGVTLGEGMGSSVTITVVAGSMSITQTVPIAITSDPGTVQFVSPSYVASEDAGSAVISVSREGGSLGTASVSYSTANGSASAPGDYGARSGTLTWAHGESGTKSFTVPVHRDGSIFFPNCENNESFSISLSGASGATLGSPSTTTVTIPQNCS